jgi:hypothetical protein
MPPDNETFMEGLARGLQGNPEHLKQRQASHTAKQKFLLDRDNSNFSTLNTEIDAAKSPQSLSALYGAISQQPDRGGLLRNKFNSRMLQFGALAEHDRNNGVQSQFEALGAFNPQMFEENTPKAMRDSAGEAPLNPLQTIGRALGQFLKERSRGEQQQAQPRQQQNAPSPISQKRAVQEQVQQINEGQAQTYSSPKDRAKKTMQENNANGYYDPFVFGEPGSERHSKNMEAERKLYEQIYTEDEAENGKKYNAEPATDVPLVTASGILKQIRDAQGNKTERKVTYNRIDGSSRTVTFNPTMTDADKFKSIVNIYKSTGRDIATAYRDVLNSPEALEIPDKLDKGETGLSMQTVNREFDRDVRTELVANKIPDLSNSYDHRMAKSAIVQKTALRYGGHVSDKYQEIVDKAEFVDLKHTGDFLNFALQNGFENMEQIAALEPSALRGWYEKYFNEIGKKLSFTGEKILQTPTGPKTVGLFSWTDPKTGKQGTTILPIDNVGEADILGTFSPQKLGDFQGAALKDNAANSIKDMDGALASAYDLRAFVDTLPEGVVNAVTKWAPQAMITGFKGVIENVSGLISTFGTPFQAEDGNTYRGIPKNLNEEQFTQWIASKSDTDFIDKVSKILPGINVQLHSKMNFLIYKVAIMMSQGGGRALSDKDVERATETLGKFGGATGLNVGLETVIDEMLRNISMERYNFKQHFGHDAPPALDYQHFKKTGESRPMKYRFQTQPEDDTPGTLEPFVEPTPDKQFEAARKKGLFK